MNKNKKHHYIVCHWCAEKVRKHVFVDSFSRNTEGCDACGCTVGSNVVVITPVDLWCLGKVPTGCFRPRQEREWQEKRHIGK